jgi:hypothetical protein
MLPDEIVHLHHRPAPLKSYLQSSAKTSDKTESADGMQDQKQISQVSF